MKIDCKTDNHIPLVVPGVQATEHRTEALGGRKQVQAVDDHVLHMVQNYQNGFQPFTAGLTRISSSATDISPAAVEIPPSSSKTVLQRERETSTIYSIIFRKTRIAKYADVRTLRECHAEDTLTIGRRFSMKNKNRDCITNMQWLCKTWRLTVFKVIQAEPDQLRRRSEVLDNYYIQKITQDPFIRTIPWN